MIIFIDILAEKFHNLIQHRKLLKHLAIGLHGASDIVAYFSALQIQLTPRMFFCLGLCGRGILPKNYA